MSLHSNESTKLKCQCHVAWYRDALVALIFVVVIVQKIPVDHVKKTSQSCKRRVKGKMALQIEDASSSNELLILVF